MSELKGKRITQMNQSGEFKHLLLECHYTETTVGES